MKTLLSLLFCLCLPLATMAITIDGQNITGDFANAPWTSYQDTETSWGANNSILACYLDTNATHLLVGIPGISDGNAVGFIIDGNPGTGSNVMPSGLTMPDAISAGMAGMTFDTAFTPDRLIAVRVGGGRTAGWPALENIVADNRTYLGGLGNISSASSVITNGSLILGAFMPVGLALDQTNTASDGIEIAIPYNLLGNVSPTVNVMVVLTGNDGTWANNQTLTPTGGDTNWINSPSAQHNASLIPGNQFMTIVISGVDTNIQVVGAISKYTLFAQSGPVTFTATVSGGMAPYTVEWNMGDGFKTNVVVCDYNYTVAGTYPVTLVGRDSGGQVLTSAVGTVTVYPATDINGLNITNAFAGADTNVVQDTPASTWGRAAVPGGGAQLERIMAYSDNGRLYIGVCGNMTTGTSDRTLGVFIDSDYAVGSNVMPLITAGSPAKLQNLAGLTFDTAFTPDKAVLLSINNPGDCWVNVYHINENQEWYWGTKTEWTSIFNPFQRVVNGAASDVVAFNDNNTAATPGEANTGFDCYLDLDTLTFSNLIVGATVRIQAILFDWNQSNIVNQSLPGINGDPNGYGLAPQVNYSLVPGNQFIEVGAPVPEPAILLGLLAAVALLRRK
ncbi:MAG: PKD domain-containing protein [bacterium]|nr:PKD domain-containing protein [bacterium]